MSELLQTKKNKKRTRDGNKQKIKIRCNCNCCGRSQRGRTNRTEALPPPAAVTGLYRVFSDWNNRPRYRVFAPVRSRWPFLFFHASLLIFCLPFFGLHLLLRRSRVLLGFYRVLSGISRRCYYFGTRLPTGKCCSELFRPEPTLQAARKLRQNSVKTRRKPGYNQTPLSATR